LTPITPENIIRHELIGLEVRIASCCNKQIMGLKGMVIDETRNAFIIDNGKNKKMIPKDIANFQFTLPDGAIVNIDGTKLVGRPENRLKTKVRKW